MKNKILILFIAAFFIGNEGYAKVFRVNYPGTPFAGTDYSTFTEAFNLASSGDTIQIYGNVSETGVGPTVSKKIVILGFGYNFDVHPNLQAVGGDAPSTISSNIYFEAGSDGSVVKGVYFQAGVFIQSSSGVALSNITFERCFFNQFTINNFNTYGQISNIKIVGCVITKNGLTLAYSGTDANTKPVTDLLIDNCILNKSGITITLNNSGTTAKIENCVSPLSFEMVCGDASVIMKNCSLPQSSVLNLGNENVIYENNFFQEAQPGTLPAGSTNNRWSQDWGTIFNRLGGTSDNPGDPEDVAFDENYYILKSGSPAINGGEDASNNPTDCGIFGGDPANKYVISGVPPIPSIYQLSATLSSGSASPYNITISTRGNN